MAEDKVISSEQVFSGEIVKIRIDTIKTADGTETKREIVERNDCVVVVAIDPEGRLLLVRQYRHPAGKDLLEIPAGGIDSDEKPEEAVIREMQEETGYLPKKVERLGGFYSTPGFCTEYMHLFLATELIPSQLHAEDTDEITLVRLEPGEIQGLIESGEIRDSKTIAGVLTYLEFRASR